MQFFKTTVYTYVPKRTFSINLNKSANVSINRILSVNVDVRKCYVQGEPVPQVQVHVVDLKFRQPSYDHVFRIPFNTVKETLKIFYKRAISAF